MAQIDFGYDSREGNAGGSASAGSGGTGNPVDNNNGGGSAANPNGDGNGNEQGEGDNGGNGTGTGVENNGNNDGNGTGAQDNNNGNNGDGNQSGDGNQDNGSSIGELEVGQVIEFDGAEYTVNQNGDLVDKDNNIFKAKADIPAWLESVQQADDVVDIDSIISAVGIDVTDDKGEKLTFTNDVDGIKSYLESVIELKSAEVEQGAINKLYQDNPLLKQFVDYVAVNGSPRGFGEIPDRTQIEVNKDDVNQQKAIIVTAAKEFGNRSITDTYLKYLEDNGGLYDEAVTQLKALQEKDTQYRNYLEAQHKAAIEQNQRETVEYFNKIKSFIDGRVVAGVKLPESYVKEVNGKKITLTPNDFYDYVSRRSVVDEETGRRITALERDYSNLSDEESMQRDILEAWLMYTGTTYKDLITMIANEKEVTKLRLAAKRNNAKSIKVVAKPDSKAKIDFGY